MTMYLSVFKTDYGLTWTWVNVDSIHFCLNYSLYRYSADSYIPEYCICFSMYPLLLYNNDCVTVAGVILHDNFLVWAHDESLCSFYSS